MGERGKPITTAKGNGVMSQVYVLIDPRTDEVRYVGRTAMGLSIRLAQHCELGRPGQEKKQKWVKELLDEGLQPVIQSVALVAPKDEAAAEWHWITYYKESGCNLLNNGVAERPVKAHLTVRLRYSLDEALETCAFGLRRFGLKSVSKTELVELALTECIPAEPTEELAAKIRARRVVLVNEGERP
jgi:hypothetical protein